MNLITISVTQAAKILNTSGETIVNYCLKGILTGSKNPISGRWSINLESVSKLQAEAERLMRRGSGGQR